MRKLLLVIALLGLGSEAFAAANRYSGELYVPVSRNAVADVNLQNARFDIGRKEDSTVASLIYAGAGRLLGMCVSGGLVATYGLAFDESVAAYVSDAAKTDTYAAHLISPTVLSPGTAATTSVALGNTAGCWWPKHPIPFSKGLVLVNSAVDIAAMALYQKD